MFEASIQNSFDFLSAEYAGLFAGSSATAFQHPRWLAALYGKLLAANMAEPLVVVVRSSADKRLAMVLPLVRRRLAFLRIVEFADLRVSDYVSPVADPRTFATILADSACVEQIRRLVRPYDLLKIGKLAEHSLELEKLFGIRRESMGMNAYATRLGDSYQEWREHCLQRSYCKELDKKSRQLHRKGNVRFECARDPAAIRAVVDAMKIYRGLRFGGPEEGGDLLQTPAYFNFYQGMALDGRDDATRTYGLWLDDRVIAGVLGLAHKGTSFLVIMGGFDFENYKNQSIGSLMFEQVARDCIERGEHYLDFTIGDEPYKMTFGAKPSPMSRIMRSGSPIGFAANLVAESMPSAKAFARRVFHTTTRDLKPGDVLPAIPEAPAADDARA